MDPTQQPSFGLGGGGLTPQQQMQLQQLKSLRTAAATPYAGSAPGGAAAQGVAQLVAALLARRKQQALMNGQPNQGLQTPQTPAPQTGPMPLMPQGLPATPGLPAQNPQALPQAIPQQ